VSATGVPGLRDTGLPLRRAPAAAPSLIARPVLPVRRECGRRARDGAFALHPRRGARGIQVAAISVFEVSQRYI